MTQYTIRRRVGMVWAAGLLYTWLRTYSEDLRQMVGDAPAWQVAPDTWAPTNVPIAVTTTVVGARDAKTTRTETCYGEGGVWEVDRMLLEGGGQPHWRDPPKPVCMASEGETPLDARLMRLLIHLFGVTRLRNPPEQNRINLEVLGGEGGEQSGEEATMQWDGGGRAPLPGKMYGKHRDTGS